MARARGFASELLLLAGASGLMLLAGAAHAQWVFFGAPDPYVRQLRVFANTPSLGTSTIQVATLGGGFLKGTDNGTTLTWTYSNTGLTDQRAWAMAASDVNTVYLGTDGSGVFKSTNAGANWGPSNGVGGTALGCRVARSMAVPGTVPTTVYAGTACLSDSGVYKSPDSGGSWSRVGVGVIPVDAMVQSVSVSGDGTLVFAATQNYGIFRSTDSGGTWAQVNTGLPGTNVFNVSFALLAGPYLAYVHGFGIYKSPDGVNWATSSTNLPANPVALGGIQRDGNNTTTFFIGLDKQGVYRSTDTGATWSPWGNTATNVTTAFTRAVSNNGGAANQFYIGTLEGIAKTTDNALTFSVVEAGGGRINSIVQDHSNPLQKFVAGVSIIPVTGDCSAAPYCEGVSTGLTGTTIDGQVEQHPVSANVLYATTSNYGLFTSANSGATWTALNNGLPASLLGQGPRITIDQSNPSVMYLSLSNRYTPLGIYKSTNAGANWSAINTGLPAGRARSVSYVTIDPNTPSTLFAQTDTGLYKSIDSGANWAVSYSALDAFGNALPISSVRVDPSNSNRVYIANCHTDPNGTLKASSGILMSTNGGTNWSTALASRCAERVRVTRKGEVYAGFADGTGTSALSISRDNGATWTDFSGGLNGSDIRTIGMDVDTNRVVGLSLENGFYVPNVTSPDFNYDGKADIGWANTDGSRANWTMNGLVPTAATLYFGGGNGWTMTLAGDFDGDGKSDLVWKHTDGSVAIWLMNGTGVSTPSLVYGAGNQWTPVLAADLDGDGKSDIVLQHPDGSIAVWLMEGTTPGSAALISGAGAGWTVTHAGDFNADGKQDLLVRHTDGRVAMWLMNGLTISSATTLFGAGSGWSASAVNDFDNDYKSDIVWKHTDGSVAIWLMNGATPVGSALVFGAGSGWSVTLTGDLNGDHKADLVWKHTDGSTAVWLMDGVNPISTALFFGGGSGWSITKLSDFNADGKADIIWKHADGSSAIWLMNGTSVTGTALLFGAGSGWSVAFGN